MKDIIIDGWCAGCGDNIEYGYEFGRSFLDVREKEEKQSRGSGSSAYARALMNLWNNQVGRKLVKRRTGPTCKCHGVSGSCNLKTCWRQLPPFRFQLADPCLQEMPA